MLTRSETFYIFDILIFFQKEKNSTSEGVSIATLYDG